MGKKREGERETEEQQKAVAAAAAAGTPDAKKRSGSPTTDGTSSGPGAAAGLCDDVVGNILARVPARTAVASMALSRRHRRLIRSPEFRSLHRRLAPPLPCPHIAYLVTATVRRRRAQDEPDDREVPASVFQGFHVAGAGGFNGNAPAPMRALAGPRFSDVGYINTCNGVVLLAAGDKYSARCRCILWNPAVADVVEEVSVPDAVASNDDVVKDYRALGLGYGQRSKIYKLILLCRGRKNARAAPARGRGGKLGAFSSHGTEYFSLVTYVLADPGKQPTTEIELPAVRGDAEISQHSLYLDGKIYLLVKHSKTNPAPILAFDVDDETVASINLPMAPIPHEYTYTSGLLELSGRPCVVTGNVGACALWLLSVDHQWDRRCLISELRFPEGCFFPDSVMGVWDCGGVLVLYYKDDMGDPDKLFLCDITTGKMFGANLGSVVTPDCSESSDYSNYALCWGYRPTLEAPSSVVGKLKQDKDSCGECSTSTYIMKALKPVAEQDRKKGQKATLNTVCFMDLLVRIMQKLPKDMQQVLEMKMVDSDDPDFTFENVLFED